MKRVISLQYSTARLLGVTFRPERRGNTFVGVAHVENDVAAKFENRDDFEVESVDASEVYDFPADFPLLAPQKAALARAGLTDLDRVRAHDFTKNKIQGIGPATVETISTYLNPPAPRTPRRPSGKAADTGKGSAAPDKPAADPPSSPEPPAE